jgi:PAS domain S-box-containing protein
MGMWPLEVQIVLFISILFQVAAALLALRLARQTGPQYAWLLIAASVALMAARRLVSLYATFAEQPDYASLVPELIALVTSALMLAGIAAIGPLLFTLRRTRDELERYVARRTAELSQVNAALQAESVEREQITEALRNSEARYRAIVEDQTDLICRYLPDGTLTFVNGAYCRMLGTTAETLIGQSFFEYVPEEDHERIRRVLSLLTPDNPMLVAEHHVVRPEGESWKQWTRQAIFDEQGQLVEIQAIGRDITRQRLMEESIREKEAQMRLIVQNLPVMVDALDEDGIFVMWNRECERVTGYSAEEMVGNPRGMERLYPDPDYLEHMRALFTQLGGDFRDWEIPLVAKDGSERIIAWSNVSKQYPIPGWQTWAIGVDITRRKQTEQALHEAHEALERRIAERTAALRLANETLQREIIERQRAEIALRASRAQLRMTIDALSDVVHVVDRDLRITLHNEAFRLMNQELGLETRAIGRTPFDLFPFLPATVRDEYRQVFETGEMLLTQETTAFSGMSIYTETRKIPVFDGDQVTHVVTVIRDITEPMRIAQALQQSERDYRGLFDSAHDAIIVFDPQNETVLDVNQHACEMYGFARQEFVGMSLDRISKDIAACRRDIAATLAAGTYHRFETTQYRQDRREMDLEVNASAVDFQGRRAILSINRDITERKRVEQALRESEERFRFLVNSMDDVIFTLDAEQRHTGVYGRWIERQGLTPDVFLGKTAREVLGEEAAGVHEQANARALTGEHVVYEWSAPVGDAVAYYQTALSPLRDLEGRVTGLVGVGRDITDRKRIEQEALQLAVEKERSVILARFIQDVSHEFANPLSVIKNRVYLALNTADAALREHHLEVVSGQVFHVEKLVEGLLTMSRLDIGFPFRHEPVPVNQVLQAICANLESAAQERKHTMITELAADLPSLMGDQRYLQLAFRHLVENAIQYTPPGGTITIRTAQQGEQVVIEVSDTGIGIAEEHLGTIFRRFFRVERARTERGAGLGLPIVRAIIEQHGGSIEVESTLDAGSTFRVFLPIGG